MKISQVTLKGYRNFKNAIINFEDKTLIIGTNDVGKTNLLYALRVLLDRSLSEQAIEPSDSDFYAYEETNEFSITIKFTAVSNNVRAYFKENVNDEDELYLRYLATRDKDTNKKTYKILAGYALDSLEENYKSRYTKALKIRYISSYRDLTTYIKRERRGLMEEAKEAREQDEKTEDTNTISDVKGKISEINAKIAELIYIKKATEGINTELNKLSYHHLDQKIAFSVGGHDVQSFIDSSKLTSTINGKNIKIGGDGRNNQIFLALWAAKNLLDKDPSVTNIFAIEEPEAHLHPQQERKMAEYLISEIDSQVILTSHSPHILSMFSPNSIIRLFQLKGETKAAHNGCSQIIDNSFTNFGYRRSIISAEAFFANVVFLVEGASEVVFYNALGNKIVDLDRYNISVLMVDGVGFSYYTRILNALEIPYIIRTDNDIIKIPYSDPAKYRMAGIQRALDLAKDDDELSQLVDTKGDLLKDLETKELSDDLKNVATEFKNLLEKQHIFLSIVDLEADLLNSACFDAISNFFENETNHGKLLKKMQKSKATFMFDFLLKNPESLVTLTETEMAKPIKECQKIAQRILTGENEVEDGNA